MVNMFKLFQKINCSYSFFFLLYVDLDGKPKRAVNRSLEEGYISHIAELNTEHIWKQAQVHSLWWFDHGQSGTDHKFKKRRSCDIEEKISLIQFFKRPCPPPPRLLRHGKMTTFTNSSIIKRNLEIINDMTTFGGFLIICYYIR